MRTNAQKVKINIINYQQLIYQAMGPNKVDLDKYRGYDSIYFFAVDERNPELLKVGKTKDIDLIRLF
jgi:hypothetical protein